MEIRRLTPTERQALAIARAAEWRGALCESQFVDRNRILYGGDFAKNRIQSFGLFKEGRSALAAASCDFVQASVLTTNGEEKVHVLASALTLPEFQKRGLMSKLLTAAFSEVAGNCLLYSDIGPEFYRRFGFKEDLWGEVVETVPPAEVSTTGWRATSRAEFARALRAQREAVVARELYDAAFLPDEGWIEWVETKYRYYVSLSGKGGVHFGLVGSEPVAFAADLLHERLDVLWGEPEAKAAWSSVAWSIANDYGLKSTRYWARGPGIKPAWPMFHPSIPRASSRLALSLGDWW